MMKKPALTLALKRALAAGQVAWADSPAATWTQKIVAPEIALKAAQAAKAEYARRGWQVVAVTDPSGLPLVVLRDRYAG